MTSPATSAKLPKAERLYLRRHIAYLIENGKTAYRGRWVALKYTWLPHQAANVILPPPTAPIMILLSVGKRKLRRAHDRNLVKRRLREAYRQHKQLLAPLLPTTEGGWAIQFILLANTVPTYAQIRDELVAGLERMVQKAGEPPVAG